MGINADKGISSTRSGWEFDEQVAPVFDAHVRKSVPFYDFVQELAELFSDWFTPKGGTVIDLGASTGETLRRIQTRHDRGLTLLGYDNSLPMIAQARQKGVFLSCADLTQIPDLPEHSYALALYALQFLPPQSRRRLLQIVYARLKPEGGVFIVEKVLARRSITQDILTQLYWEMKETNGLTSAQVSAKAKALRGRLYLKTVAGNEREFEEIGFRCEIVFKAYQFAGWLLMK